MHRSGTSAVSGSLIKWGASAPKTLLQPAPDNPLGFWESWPLVQFHDRLLARQALSWDNWERAIDTRLEQSFTDEDRAELGGIVEAEFGDSPLFVLKDPRLSLFLPVWRQTARELGIRLCPILVLRSPVEVALSLAQRDRFDIDVSVLIWLRYNLLAERWTRDLQRVVLTLDRFIDDGRAQISRIASCFDIGCDASSAAFESFIDPQLRHHSDEDFERIRDEKLRAIVQRAHGALLSLTTGPNAEAEALLDAVSESLDALLVESPALQPRRGTITQVRRFSKPKGVRRFGLERPVAGTPVRNRPLDIAGWLVPESPEQVRQLELWQDDVLLETFAANQLRQDVANAIPDLPHAKLSGFRLRVRFNAGLPQFTLRLGVRLHSPEAGEWLAPLAEISGAAAPDLSAPEPTILTTGRPHSP